MVQVTFNFTGVTPVEGGGQSDYVQPGRYRLRITKFEDGQSSNGNRMVTVNYETVPDGKRLNDRFVLSSDFGMRRFMGLFVAIGVRVPQQQVTIDTDRLVGRECEAAVGDDTIAPSAEYPNPRTVSRINTYFFPPELAAEYGVKAAPAATQPTPAPVAQPAPAPAPAPAAVVPAVEVAQPAPAPQPAAPVQPAPQPAPAVNVPVSSTLDDLFSA